MRVRERNRVKSVNNKLGSGARVKADIPSWKERVRLIAACERRLKIQGAKSAGRFRLAGDGDVVPFPRQQFTFHVSSITLISKVRWFHDEHNSFLLLLSPKNIENGDNIR